MSKAASRLSLLLRARGAPGSPPGPWSKLTQRSSTILLIRRFLCGHPHSFRSVRHLGGIPVGCPLKSGEPGSRSSVGSQDGSQQCLARGAGFPRAGAGKILPRAAQAAGWWNTRGGEPIDSGVPGAASPRCRQFPRRPAPWCSPSPGTGANAPPSLGVHPLAVGHPPGSGLGPAGEGGAPRCLTDLRPRGRVCWACPGRRREGESPPQPGTDNGCSCTSRSILEPEAPPEANLGCLVSSPK
jgi:hypothetical protein